MSIVDDPRPVLREPSVTTGERGLPGLGQLSELAGERRPRQPDSAEPRAARRPATSAAAAVAPARPMIAMALSASSTLAAKTLTQSKEREAGTTPSVETTPSVGLKPTIPWKRGRDPARARGVGADPEVGQPERDRDRRARSSSHRRSGPAPRRCGRRRTGVRVPTRPVANWSRLVLPSTTAPASTSRATEGRGRRRLVGERRAAGRCRQPEHVDVVLDRHDLARERQVSRRARRPRRPARIAEGVGFRPEGDPHLRPVCLADALVRGADAPCRCSLTGHADREGADAANGRNHLLGSEPTTPLTR